ncbi:MAG: hypothetical protein JWN40_2127 [Phycisphaerales bacterium]|jgi:hypothetical protein|nr:hypothetical protein [Phycisphaerales bacterium]
MKRRISAAMCALMSLGLGCNRSSNMKPQTTAPPVKMADAASDFPQPKDARLLMRFSARGDQIYTVKAGANGKPEWSPATPDARLFDNKGKEVGTHGKGPHWTLTDGGTVIGQLPPAKKAVPDPSAVPWLEINAKPGSAAGSLKDVIIIQRVKTAGGIPSATELTETNIGKEFRAPYTADYLFYVPAK